MSDIVTLTENGCQAGCREDEMRVETAETPAPLTRLYRKLGGAHAPKDNQRAAVGTSFGI
jgi:hypothetical protein